MITLFIRLFGTVCILIFVLSCTKIQQTPVPKSTSKPSLSNLSHSKKYRSFTIKFKKNINAAQGKDGYLVFGIPSLDQLAQRYQVVSMKPAFTPHRALTDTDQVDLSQIYHLFYINPVQASIVARAFSKNSNVEYAEPNPVMKLDEKVPVQ